MIVGIATGFKDVSGALGHDLVLRRWVPKTESLDQET